MSVIGEMITELEKERETKLKKIMELSKSSIIPCPHCGGTGLIRS